MDATDSLRKIVTLARTTEGDPLVLSDALAGIEREALAALAALDREDDDGPDPAKMDGATLRHIINYERSEGRAFGYTAEKCRDELAKRGARA
jgi:hypothetical protein